MIHGEGPNIEDLTTQVAATDRSTESYQNNTSANVNTATTAYSTSEKAKTNRVTSTLVSVDEQRQNPASQKESTVEVSSTPQYTFEKEQQTESDNDVKDNMVTNYDYLQYTTDRDVNTVDEQSEENTTSKPSKESKGTSTQSSQSEGYQMRNLAVDKPKEGEIGGKRFF